MTGIYFHIPFCARKCSYCDFFSVPYQKETAERCTAAILRNLAYYRVKEPVDSLYFGGGTPSLLTPGQLGAILDACAKHLHLAADTEITLELNPSGNRSNYLKEVHALGINRLSIGTQSFSDRELQLLGRTHTAEKAVRTVWDAYNAGFRNLSCDLMLACPEQTEAVLEHTLEILTSLPITHVSSYLLQVEEGTPLSRDTSLLRSLPDEDSSADRYLQAVRHLERHGFAQYEVSSFAKQGYESRHNLKYWRCEPYLGIGAGAHSCYGGTRFYVPKDLAAFCDAPFQKTVLVDPNPCGREERIMLLLRTREGVPASLLGYGAASIIAQLEHAGYLRQMPDGNIALTAEGFAVSNAVIARLLDAANAEESS